MVLNIHGSNMVVNNNEPVKVGTHDCAPLTVVTAGSHWRCTIPEQIGNDLFQVKVWFQTETKPVLLYANVSLQLEKDDFSTVDMSLWQATASSAYPSTNCGARSGTKALWFGDLRRFLQTQPFVLPAGSVIPIEYYVRRGSGGYPCETPDGGEDLGFEVRLPTNVVVLLQRHMPSSSSTTFTKVTFEYTVPTTGVYSFQFRQLAYTSSTFDSWAVDDFSMGVPGGFTAKNPDNHHPGGGSRVQLETTGVKVQNNANVQAAKDIILPLLAVMIDGNVVATPDLKVDQITSKSMFFSFKLPSQPVGNYTLKASLTGGNDYKPVEPELQVVPFPTVSGVSMTQGFIPVGGMVLTVTGTGFRPTTWFRFGDQKIKGGTNGTSTEALVVLNGDVESYCSICHSVGNVASTAAQAQTGCPTGQSLSSVHLSQDNDLIKQSLATTTGCDYGWIGYRVQSGNTSWSDGSVDDFTYFTAGAIQPTNGTVIVSSMSGKWNWTSTGASQPKTCGVCKRVSFAHSMVSNVSVSLNEEQFKSSEVAVRFARKLQLRDNVPAVIAVNKETPAVFTYTLSGLTGSYGARLVLNCSQGSTVKAYVGLDVMLDVPAATAAHVTSSVIASINRTMDTITVNLKGSSTLAPGFDTCSVVIEPTIPVSNSSSLTGFVASGAISIQGNGRVLASGSGFVNQGLSVYFDDKVCGFPVFQSSNSMGCDSTPTFLTPRIVKCFVLNNNQLAGTLDIVVYNLTRFMLDVQHGPSTGGTAVTLSAIIDLPLDTPLKNLNASVTIRSDVQWVVGKSYDRKTKTLVFEQFVTAPQSTGLETVSVQLDGKNQVTVDGGFRFYESISLNKVNPSLLIKDFVANDTATIESTFAVSYGSMSKLLMDNEYSVPFTLSNAFAFTLDVTGDFEDRLFQHTECPSGSEKFNGMCYRAFSGVPNYGSASSTCRAWSKRAQPTVVQSQAENDFVRGLLQGCGHGWMGLEKSIGSQPIWLGKSQYVVDWANWANGQPANMNGHGRMSNVTGEWSVGGDGSANCVVCQYFGKEAVDSVKFK
eukprot:TRINITY_DN773_c0_g1_i1.p1 TRINITY_DN773_c0_g1~~TRINITY_DN773_c0_g1_i1.p1  ORF type:complete len:1042 (-),score=283.98 TRINITY_DN773_c0_g1_i1:137-3262(-)